MVVKEAGCLLFSPFAGGMQSVFWPVSLDQCAVGPWLLQAEFNSSSEPRAHRTHTLHERTNTHMLTSGIVRYVSAEY